MFSRLQYEKAKLSALQSTKLLLLPNSLSITELGPSRLQLDMQVADTVKISLAIFLSSVDFKILTTDLIPMEYFDDQGPPPGYPTTGLVELADWVLHHYKKFTLQQVQRSGLFGELCGLLDTVSSMGVLGDKDSEIALSEDGSTGEMLVVVVVRLRPEQQPRHASLVGSARTGRLLNQSDHCVFYKFVLRNNGELADGSGLLVSPNLARLVPGLSPALQQPPAQPTKDSYFVQFLLNAQETLNRLVESGLESWDRRARLLLPLYAMLEDGSRAVPSLDTDTMDVLQLAFRTQADTKVVLWLRLTENYPAVGPEVWLEVERPTRQSRLTRRTQPVIEKVCLQAEFEYTEDITEEEVIVIILEQMLHAAQNH